MRKGFLPFAVLALLGLLLLPRGALAWNSGTHVLIAGRAFGFWNLDLAYGSIAPDLSLYPTDPLAWPDGFMDTHYKYIHLRPYAFWRAQKAFSWGWLSHSVMLGADRFAHVFFPLDVNPLDGGGSQDGYVIQKAAMLSSLPGVDPEVGHWLVEVAVDLLVVKNDDQQLGNKLLAATLNRSILDLTLMVRVLDLKFGAVEWKTLLDAETNFRRLVFLYALALSAPDPVQGVSVLGSQLSMELFGEPYTAEDVRGLLNLAMGHCEGDYAHAIDYTVEEVRLNLGLP